MKLLLGALCKYRSFGGAVQPTSGQILVDGRPLRLRSPRDAFQQGIATVYQELSLVPELTVGENILFFRMVMAGMQEAADKAGVPLRVDNTDNRPEEELRLINTYLTLGIDAIVISPLGSRGSARVQGFRSQVARLPGVTIVQQQDAWDPATAHRPTTSSAAS